MMNKFLSISLALFILLTGMNLTIATHFCCGEIAATKVSFGGKVASCGMESDENANPSSETNIASNCCENEFILYSVDSNFAPSEFHFNEITQNILHEFSIPEGFSFQFNYLSSSNLTNVSPPVDFLTNAVSMADICVFRI